MDIGFLREDYQKFLGVCRQELSDKFTLVTTDEPKYGLPYGKIMLKNTVFLEKGLLFLTVVTVFLLIYFLLTDFQTPSHKEDLMPH